MEDDSQIDKLFDECLDDAKNKHKKYNIEFKLKVLKLIDLNVSLYQISAKLGIDRNILRDWKKKREQLLDVKNKNKQYRCKRTKGLNTIFTEEELIIKNWIVSCRKNYAPVSTKSLICYAGNIKEKFKDKDLNLKLQWAYRFLKRYGFSIRRISHIGQFIPREQNDIKTNFIEEIIKARKELDIGYLDNERVLIWTKHLVV